MHFVFEATKEDGKWVASWGGEIPAQYGIIVTEAATKEELEAFVKDAIETHLEGFSKLSGRFTSEILYL
jgi:predicted RNase H-like HicB family nuclease